MSLSSKCVRKILRKVDYKKIWPVQKPELTSQVIVPRHTLYFEMSLTTATVFYSYFS